MSTILLGIGMVFVIEGLVLALAPDFYEKGAEMLRQTPPDTRRVVGITAVALGVGLVWLSGI